MKKRVSQLSLLLKISTLSASLGMMSTNVSAAAATEVEALEPAKIVAPADLEEPVQAEEVTEAADEPLFQSPDIQSAGNEVSDYEFLASQIAASEAQDAQRQLETIIEDIEQDNHRYVPELVVPVALLGDALFAQDQYDDALSQYTRARHIARVSHGLFDARQLPLIYKEANAHRKLGNIAAAAESEEYAFEVSNRAYGRYATEQLPALYRLAAFYLETSNYLAARSMYARALSVHNRNGTHGTPAAIPALQGLATAVQLQRFPPVYISANSTEPRLSPVGPGLLTSDLNNQTAAINSFPDGEKALQRVVEIRASEKPANPAGHREALLDLADWHMMFGRTNTANTLYSHIYGLLEQDDEDAAAFFAEPQLLYFPRPEDPRPPTGKRAQQARDGVVSLRFDVSATGRVRKLKTVESIPPKLMDFRVRRSMREAVYRPRLVEGVAQASADQTFDHRFNYFTLSETPTPEPQTSPDTQAPEPATEDENATQDVVSS